MIVACLINTSMFIPYSTAALTYVAVMTSYVKDYKKAFEKGTQMIEKSVKENFDNKVKK